ncbi:conserved hypothetical protein [Rhizobium mesoamericanum STM3625]|uniref:Transmembrane protein n=1 Tax=Rhizobium mesoamericanum STM3625 TaxID=1211777 RepID=K0PX50_9HYPH|nr:conserved hypothetical protein [Rhizobium mesoamericanum STM3625]
MFLFIIHIWWWEYRLQAIPVLHIGIYLFLVSFCLFVMLCALRSTACGYEDYSYSSRRWFFGTLHVLGQAISNFLVANRGQM